MKVLSNYNIKIPAGIDIDWAAINAKCDEIEGYFSANFKSKNNLAELRRKLFKNETFCEGDIVWRPIATFAPLFSPEFMKNQPPRREIKCEEVSAKSLGYKASKVVVFEAGKARYSASIAEVNNGVPGEFKKVENPTDARAVFAIIAYIAGIKKAIYDRAAMLDRGHSSAEINKFGPIGTPKVEKQVCKTESSGRIVALVNKDAMVGAVEPSGGFGSVSAAGRGVSCPSKPWGAKHNDKAGARACEPKGRVVDGPSKEKFLAGMIKGERRAKLEKLRSLRKGKGYGRKS